MSELSLFDLDAAPQLPTPTPAAKPVAPKPLGETEGSPRPKHAAFSLRAFNPVALAFAAVAVGKGIKDPALAPTRIDTAGCRFFDERELARFANEQLCGIRSDKPTVTPERWRLATEKLRAGDGLR